jgi:hypothetical protein
LYATMYESDLEIAKSLYTIVYESDPEIA